MTAPIPSETRAVSRPPARPVAGYVLAGVILAGTLGGLLASPVLAQSPNGWLLSQGSQVAGVNVSGLSPQAAAEAVADTWAIQRETYWTLTAGDQTFKVTPATLGLSAELAGVRAALEAAQPAPKTTWERLTRYVAPHDPTDIDLELTLDQATFDAWIRTVRPSVDRPVTNATIDWANKTVVAEQPGQTFDKGAWQALLDDPLPALEPRHIELPVGQIAPSVTSASLGQVRFEEPFAEFSTRFDLRKASRSHNIATAVAKWQGVVIPPHGTISFNETVGQRTAANGYKVAPVYENRRVSEGYGGGICQVSTTLYNTALIAGLKIHQRSGHSRPCDYAPPGRDSTVDWPSRDLKFENPYDFPLYIDAETDGGTVRFRFYGDQSRRPKIVLSEEVSWTGGPGEPDMVLDPSLPVGTKKTHDAGFGGRKIVVTRIWDPGTPQERTEIVSTDRIGALRGIVHYNPGADGAFEPVKVAEPIPNPEGEVPQDPANPMPF